MVTIIENIMNRNFLNLSVSFLLVGLVAIKNKKKSTEEIRQGINENVSWYYDVSEEQKREWLMLDQGLVAMQLMLSAKDRGYDTVAMSGFKTEAVRKLFNIEDHLVNGLIIPIGKAQTPGFETVRRDVSEVVTWLD